MIYYLNFKINSENYIIPIVKIRKPSIKMVTSQRSSKIWQSRDLTCKAAQPLGLSLDELICDCIHLLELPFKIS
jgi:hypothetical protein